ncbi:hypothetical protein C8035_v011210 [Colletotrichum spinosum]|uniref:Uncharacterized protein n=1 Tax=Colletotrichum spinosum TaxID=1347390 RepID=A0A4R8Q8V6_9PEZI|nr:hypothetical protein C8035_v011210 [Colletotrichum spinosum]
MRPLQAFIPRLYVYAPLTNLTCQSFRRFSPALTAVGNAAATRTSGLNGRMSTSSESQSPFSWTSASSAAAATSAVTKDSTRNNDQQQQTQPSESHSQHHPTKSTSPAPENTTSNAGPTAATTTADSSQPRPPSTQQPLSLPPLPEAPSTSGNSARAAAAAAGRGGRSSPQHQQPVTLDLGGQAGGSASTRLDHLGPLVVNQDGTMSRISNWGEMTEIERQNTLRFLGRRNQIRLAKLRDGAGGEGEAEKIDSSQQR